MKPPSEATIRLLNRGLFVAGTAPFLFLAAGGLTHGLGANPVETISHGSGLWTLRFLLGTLAITPLARFPGGHWLIHLRRTTALLAFFYACLHVSSYLIFDQLFDAREIWRDIVRRPFISAGMTSFLIMVPLAATSNQAMARRLGHRNWRLLHRWVYVSAAAGVFHYFWLVKRDTSGPALYAAILAIVLCLRLDEATRRRAGRPSATAPRPSIADPSAPQPTD
ncbi:protein-methionine-sulfoxide reductase heme-binding subunit MsrQ [Methylococcus capsulatus]|jgi:sulfoxide reductase heme-binding subunit YedZ|uniref:Protein-methionine-sulfoxide reductase heme-binding subunit MsrQ n=1 Tax=Methylococcus capsulatus TaxID=414 RepID=A0AA35XVA7_METCP|nr:protein-methionine-sulfoxide reductase heme-binding subunit MsrQ [Methylococcus capsulatus]CAI8828374.1 Protein-methionine-sulfoxide reductase heme-binding subunit MsrQ [Methylococcus capsulatus]